MPSRRDRIRMSTEEQRALLEGESTMIIATHGPRGWPHVMPMWFVLREAEGEPRTDFPGEPWVWTYGKSQKVRNLERDPRATLLVERGTEYTELCGIQVEARAHIVGELEPVTEFALELMARYTEGFTGIEGDAHAALEAQAEKRVAIRLEPERVVSWDHSKLGGTY